MSYGLLLSVASLVEALLLKGLNFRHSWDRNSFFYENFLISSYRECLLISNSRFSRC
jgi:hypothetical protein